MGPRITHEADAGTASHKGETNCDLPLLISSDRKTAALLEIAARAARSETTILLTGESGTGKDVLARQIHRWSRRREGPFVVVNCASLVDQLMENELFGHVRGAFTGAVNDQPGRLETADSGTLFFDEIAGLSEAFQTKLLRFVEERCLERVGGNRTIKVDARILAASARELESEVASGRLREDLYYRLNVVTLRLPPLRERRQDIVALSHWLLDQAAGKLSLSPWAITPEAIQALSSYRWPGNIRELRNILERALIVAGAGIITVDDLPERIFADLATIAPSSRGARLKEHEREYILRVLAESRTLERAAEVLGINVTTLWRKRKRYGIG